jgi:hypothetical protein
LHQHIIVVEKHDPRGSGRPKTRISRRRPLLRAVVRQDGKAGIVEAREELRGGIGRGVLDNDDVEMHASLAEDGFEAFGEYSRRLRVGTTTPILGRVGTGRIREHTSKDWPCV